MKKELTKRIISSIILVPFALFFIIKGSFLFNFFIFICFLITAYEWHKMTKEKTYNIFGYLFLIISFYSIYKLRHDFPGDYELLLGITIVCVSTDIGGYIFGKIFKGPKLIRISPKKTYSGMIGGYFLSIISINFFLGSFLNNLSLKLTTDVFIFVLIISTFSQIGDILISYLKRRAKVKDTSDILPGHGGFLDRIDGIIFALPIGILLFSFNL